MFFVNFTLSSLGVLPRHAVCYRPIGELKRRKKKESKRTGAGGGGAKNS